jgi:hypothetical protein
MRLFFIIFIGGLLLTQKIIAEPSSSERLATAMIGTFSTANQALVDQDLHNITLHIIRTWSDRADGPWLYVEQALTDASEHPYRQFIYQLAPRKDGRIGVHILNLPDPIAATGAWKNPHLIDKFSPANCTLQRECTLIIQALPDGTFMGNTSGVGCPSSLRGASYATTELLVSARQLKIWDRGYNTQGTQVWGSVSGGYLFKKLE